MKSKAKIIYTEDQADMDYLSSEQVKDKQLYLMKNGSYLIKQLVHTDWCYIIEMNESYNAEIYFKIEEKKISSIEFEILTPFNGYKADDIKQRVSSLCLALKKVMKHEEKA